MSKEEIVGFLSDMIDALTWKRFFLLTLSGIVLLLLLVTFESRNTIFNRLFGPTPVEGIPTPWSVSEETQAELTALTKNPLIGAVLLTEVDLKKNRRITRFWSSRDADFRQEALNVSSTLLPQAFFDTDKKNNDQMIAILSNQFVCSPSKDTVFIRFFPDIAKKFPTVCRLAVPPFTGEFAGMVTVLLVKQPTEYDVDSLKIELTRVSVELYLRDIQKARRP